MPPLQLADDDAFDEQLPKQLQEQGPLHFTPVEVARRAASWLAPRPGMLVLDVGSGAGKFCLIAAHAAPNARFVGVELRSRLVRLANRLASDCEVTNTFFVHGDAFDLDWSIYDAFYFFNPFAEQLFGVGLQLDVSLDLDPVNYIRYVMAVQERLVQARPGTRVVTYHGYGGPPLAGYELAGRHAIGSDYLELWIKTAESRAHQGESQSILLCDAEANSP